VESFLLGQALAIVVLLAVIIATEKGAASILRIFGPANAGLLSRAWSYGAPFAPISFLSWLANLGDRYTLAFLLGTETTGRYVAPFSVASRPMGLASGALCDLFRPILFDAENRGDSRHARRIFVGWIASSIVLSAAALTVIYFGGGLIIRLLLAPDYRNGAVTIMLWVALGYAFCGVTGVVENRLFSLGHSGRVILPMIIGALGNVTLSFVLIRLHGIVGAAQATCGSFVLQSLATIGFLLHALSGRSHENVQKRHVEIV
jgi:O-antigen/teichoic acid export membrane protein